MSRQRFPCRDRDDHDKRSGVAIGLALCRDFMSQQSVFVSQHSLVKARSFYVATEYFYVATEFGQDQEFLCRDRVS